MEETFRRVARETSRLGLMVEGIRSLNAERTGLEAVKKTLVDQYGHKKYAEMAKEFPVDKIESNGMVNNGRGYEEFDTILRAQADSPWYVEQQIGKVKKKREELRKLNGFMGHVAKVYCFLFR